MSVMEQIKERSAYALAADADVPGPDSLDSPGAHFLTRVRDGVVEAIEFAQEHMGDATLADAVERVRDDDVVEIADGAPSVYTHELWKQFLDLCAYQEDVSELAPDVSNLNSVASTALYQIATRLINALLDEIEGDDA